MAALTPCFCLGIALLEAPCNASASAIGLCLGAQETETFFEIQLESSSPLPRRLLRKAHMLVWGFTFPFASWDIYISFFPKDSPGLAPSSLAPHTDSNPVTQVCLAAQTFLPDLN